MGDVPRRSGMKIVVLTTAVLAVFASVSLAQEEVKASKEYMPLATGNSWDYKVTAWGWGKEKDGRLEISEKVSEGRFRIKTKNIDLGEAPIEFCFEDDFFLWKYTKEQVSLSMPMLKFGARKGDSWTTKIPLYADPGLPPDPDLAFTLNSSIAAVEDVTTPAGQFKNCLKVVHTHKMEDETWIVTVWFAKGVGIVKFTEGEEREVEWTWTLAGYKVAQVPTSDRISKYLKECEVALLVEVTSVTKTEAVKEGETAKEKVTGKVEKPLKGKFSESELSLEVSVGAVRTGKFVFFLKKGEKGNELVGEPLAATEEIIGFIEKALTEESGNRIQKPKPLPEQEEKVKNLVAEARTALSKGDKEKAKELILKALQLDPKNPESITLKKIIDYSAFKELRTLSGHGNYVLSVCFSPDGRTLASGSYDGIKLWDVATGKELRTLRGHAASVKSVSFSPDGRTIASGSRDKTVKLWDVANGKELRTLSGHTDFVASVNFSPDGSTLASASGDKTIKLWDVASGKELRTLSGHTNGVVSVSFSPDGRTIASGSYKEIKLWEVATGKELRTLSGHTFLSFSSDGSILASCTDTTIKLWDPATGKELRTLSGHIEEILSVSFSPDGSTLASASGDRTIRLWEVSSGSILRILRGYKRAVFSVSFSPDGRILASGSADETVKLWDVEVK